MGVDVLSSPAMPSYRDEISCCIREPSIAPGEINHLVNPGDHLVLKEGIIIVVSNQAMRDYLEGTKEIPPWAQRRESIWF